MRGIAFQFMIAAIGFGLIGMLWGLQMTFAGDHLMKQAHAHLVLVGFGFMSVFAVYYAITPQAAGGLARAHFWLTLVAVVLMNGGIAWALSGASPALAAIGSALATASLALFGVIVWRYGIGRGD